MSVTPGDLLAEAKALRVAARGSEARRRTIVGRAYYAAYHSLLIAAQALGYRYSKENNRPPGSHENLIDWAMRQSSTHDLRIAAERLRALKHWRRKADYTLDIDVSFSNAEYCLATAQAVINDLAPA